MRTSGGARSRRVTCSSLNPKKQGAALVIRPVPSSRTHKGPPRGTEEVPLGNERLDQRGEEPIASAPNGFEHDLRILEICVMMAVDHHEACSGRGCERARSIEGSHLVFL